MGTMKFNIFSAHDQIYRKAASLDASKGEI